MKKWPTRRLSDVAEVFNGKTPPKGEQRESGYPVLKIRDVDGLGTFRGPFQSFVDDTYAAKYNSKFVRKGDLLILNAAHSATHVASKTYRASPQAYDALATGEWLVVRPSSESLDPGFMSHWINHPATRGRLREIVNGIHLYPRDVAALDIPLPPLPEQRRIAAILDHADALRTKRREALSRLDELAQTVFIETFDSDTPHLIRPLGEVADVASGITKGRRLSEGTPTTTVPYMTVANVQDKNLDLTTVKEIEATEAEISRYRLKYNDLLLTEGGDPDKLGRGTLWREELPLTIHQNHIFRVRSTSDAVDPVYMNWSIGSRHGKAYFLRSAKQTTGIASINSTQLKNFPLPIPPMNLQSSFKERIREISRTKRNQLLATEQLETLFQALQSRAFRGEL
ncbi:restriction endonuclease subunit S [Antrihabitans spumae]|uniref:Restriction endonuclease subunit S n=1 Tax=Antrihabitans spumae TaxID=3373370 RepID=A0ABW7JYN4_9NOCA